MPLFSSLADGSRERFTTLLLPALLSMAAAGTSMLVMSLMRDLRHRSAGPKRNRDKESASQAEKVEEAP
jgi:hypothetical protein